MSLRLRMVAMSILVACSAFSLSQNIVTLKPSQLKGFRLLQYCMSGYSMSKATPGNVVKKFSLQLQNATRETIYEIDVRLRVDNRKTGALVYASKPFTIKRFITPMLAHYGEAPPMQDCLNDKFVTFDYSGQYWRPDTHDVVELVAIRVNRGPKDLHNIGHLYAKLFYSTPAQAIALFKADPTLCTVQNESKTNATHVAFMVSEPKVIEYVATHGGSYKLKTATKLSIMDFAALNLKPGALDLALKHGGNVNNVGYESPLFRASKDGNAMAVKWLLNHNAKPDLPCQDNRTPAYAAITFGQIEILKILAKGGANPKAYMKDGLGWMEYGIRNYYMFPEILKYGCKIDQRSPLTGRTALLQASVWGFYDAMTWLLQHGADPDAKDKYGKTAYDYSKLTNTLKTDRFYRDLVKQYSTKKKK